jgi:hypothetical protein
MAAHVQQQKAVIPGHEEMIECLEGAFECQVLERQCYSGSGPLVKGSATRPLVKGSATQAVLLWPSCERQCYSGSATLALL